MKYKLKNITPKEHMCILIHYCPAIYELKELTEDCGIGVCPKVYDLKESTENCMAGACQTVFSGKETYVIIGKKISPEKVTSLGLESKIGSDETIIEIDKSILDNVFKH